MTGRRWSTDPNINRLTGKKRLVHHVYFGYKIVRNDKGKLEVVQSEMVDNIADLPEDYIYITEDFVEKIYSEVQKVEELHPSVNDDVTKSENYDSELQSEYDNQLKLVR